MGKKILFTLSILLIFYPEIYAQLKTVNGAVFSSQSNQPIANAAIVVKGTSRGATSDEMGRFSISAAESQTLIISHVGFLNKEQLVGYADTMTVYLTEDINDMNDVVVTALGIKRDAKALGYANTVVAGEELTDALSANWTDALSGKVPGLNLVRSGAGPTGSSKIILRGESNLTGDNEALIVVDGVVINQGSGRRTAVSGENIYGTGSDNMPADYGSSINDINPEDIESVNILRGPGAAALYGERGANGAIIITTKSGGKKKKGWGVTLNSNYSMEEVNRWPGLQFEYGQGLDGQSYYSYGAGVDGASTSGTSSAYGPKFDGQQFYQYSPTLQARDTARTPWIGYRDKINTYFEKGNTFTNTLSLDGGTERTSARFSITNVNNKWIMPNTGYKRNTVALSVNSKVNDKLQISSKINYTNKWSDNLPGAGYGNQSIMYWYIFWQPNADLDWLREYWVRGQEGRKIKYPYSTYPENPFAIAYEFINKNNRHGITGNISAVYNIAKGLNLTVRTSMDMAYEQRAQQRPYDAGSRYQKGSYRTQNLFSQEASTDFLLKYEKKVNSDFDFSITLGGSTLKNNYNRDELRADSLTYPGVYSFSNAAGPLVALPYKSTYKINSLYGLLTAAYKNFLFADLTMRQDWSSMLATPERSTGVGFFYPSANLSFIASEVWDLPKQINFAKLRLSVAGVGSGSTTPYRTAYYYETAGALYNGALQNPSLLANPDLRPLKTISYEAGVDIRMFKSRLGMDLTYYMGSTKDQILERILDRSSGFTREVINLGRVNNSGLEIALHGNPIKKKDFSWNTRIVYSSNKNEIMELADSSVVLRNGPVAGGQIVAKVGGSMGDMYGRGYQRSPDGQVIYDPNTGFALITENVVYIGNTTPKGKLGFNNTFTYKQLKLGFQFDAQWGAVAHSLMHFKMVEQGKLKVTLPGRYNGIIGNGVVQNPDGTYRKNDVTATDIDEYYRSHMGTNNAEGSSFSTDFIKFRELRLDYSLNATALKALGIQRATIGLYGRDLFIWSPWPMFDPEFGTLSGTDIVQGFETAQFPSTRTMGVNLIIGF